MLYLLYKFDKNNLAQTGGLLKIGGKSIENSELVFILLFYGDDVGRWFFSI